MRAEKRFPVANTSPLLTVPWEVAQQAQDECNRRFDEATILDVSPKPWTLDEWASYGGMTIAELDTWYGRHWREVAE